MRRAWAWWVALLCRRERGTTLAAFRIAVGLVVIYSLLSIASADLVDVLWVDQADGGYRSLPAISWPVRLLGGATRSTAWTLWSLSLAGAIAMTLGLGGRWPLAVVAVAYQPLATINNDAYGGYEMMIGNAVWLLFLGNATATLSLDCRRKTGAWRSEQLVAAWPRYIAVLQLLVIYTSTGLHKLSADWIPGGSHSALYWVFQEPTWTRFDLREITGRLYPMTQIATALTWVWEVTALGMLAVLWFRDTPDRAGRLRRVFNRVDLRKPWAVVGVGLHIGILVTLDVGPFSWISLAYYLCLWTPEELERAAGRLRRRRIQATSAAALLVAWLSTSEAHASPINAEPLRSTQGKYGWSGAVDLSGGIRSGNVDKLEASSTGAIQFQSLHPSGMGFGELKRPPHAPRFFKDRWILAANVRWARLSGSNFLNSGAAHTRYTRMIIPRLGTEVFLQSQYNQFTLLRARLVGGAGPRFDVVHRLRVNVWGGTSYMLEYEVNDVEPGDPHPAFLLNQRWSNYLVLQLFLADQRVLLQNTAYVQPLWISFRDVRVLDSFELEGKVTEVFRMGISFGLQYDSRPPRTVERTDITLSSYAKFQFG